MNTEALLALLKEAREWIQQETDFMFGRTKTSTPHPMALRLDAAIAELEAALERKCGTCRHLRRSPDPFFIPNVCENLNGLHVRLEFLCSDWQPRGGGDA